MTKLLVYSDAPAVTHMLEELLKPLFLTNPIQPQSPFDPAAAILVLDAPSLSYLEELRSLYPEALFVCLLSLDQVRSYELLPYIRIIEKPCRVHQLFQVLQNVSAQVYNLGPYVFYPAHRFLKRQHDNETIPLTEKETEMLRVLYQNAGTPVQREVLLKQVWGYGSDLSTHTLETHIYRLRKKLEIPNSPEILSSHAIGYILNLPLKV